MMKITVCVGNCCHTKGSRQVMEALQKLISQSHCKGDVDLAGEFCMRNCQPCVAVRLDGKVYSVSPEAAGKFFQEKVLALMPT